MAEEARDDTRTQILRVALQAFAKRGFHGTSVRDIAERVGVTKTAVLYHFPSKADILAGLADPFLTSLETGVKSAELAPNPAWAVIENVLETVIANRYLLRMNLHDLAFAGSTPILRRFRDAMLRANSIVAGGKTDLGSRVRAAQAIAMLTDPVVLFADAPTHALRAHVLAGIRKFLAGDAPSTESIGTPELPEPGPEPTRRGRPRAMDAATIGKARRMHEEGKAPAVIADALGVSRATLYRALVSK